MTATRFAYISRGEGGIGADYAERGHHLSSYSRDLEGFISEHATEAEGSIVVDLLPCVEREEFVSAVMRAPLCDPTLAPGDINAPTFHDDGAFGLATAATIAGNYLGAFGVSAVLTAEAKTDDAEPGPFDSVSPQRLARYWREHGATVGVVREGSIIWEGGNR